MFFKNSFHFIDKNRQAGNNVLVHCRAGISRSSTIVIAYLIQKDRLSFEDALQLVRSSRPIVMPNKGFVKQLKKLAS